MRAALDRLALDAEAGKALQSDLEGLRSLRVARFRVIYRAPARRVIEIVSIGPGDRICEKTLPWFRRSPDVCVSAPSFPPEQRNFRITRPDRQRE